MNIRRSRRLPEFLAPTGLTLEAPALPLIAAQTEQATVADPDHGLRFAQ